MAAVIAAKGDPTPWFENGMSNKLLLVFFIFYILSLLTGQVGTNLRTHQLLSDDNLGKWISDFICEYTVKKLNRRPVISDRFLYYIWANGFQVFCSPDRLLQ